MSTFVLSTAFGSEVKLCQAQSSFCFHERSEACLGARVIVIDIEKHRIDYDYEEDDEEDDEKLRAGLVLRSGTQ